MAGWLVGSEVRYLNDYLVSWIVGELPYSLAVFSTCLWPAQLMPRIEALNGEEGSEREFRKEEEKEFLYLVRPSRPQTQFPSMPVFRQIKEMRNLRVMLFSCCCTAQTELNAFVRKWSKHMKYCCHGYFS